MSLKDQLAKAPDLRRETVKLPRAGVTVQVRELLFGDLDRATYTTAEKRNRTIIASVVEDPATGKLVWDHSDYDDLEAIGRLYKEDTDALMEAINRLSGLDAAGNDPSKAIESSPSLSPAFSPAVLRNSA